MSTSDLNRLVPSSSASAANDSSAQLEKTLAETTRRLNMERLLFAIILLIVWDAHEFRSMSAWTGPLMITLLELIGIFLLAYMLKIHEVIVLFWAGMRGYAGQSVGDAPADNPD